VTSWNATDQYRPEELPLSRSKKEKTHFFAIVTRWFGTTEVETLSEVVVIGLCTCRRPSMLRACLDSLAAQIAPEGCSLHIVVVDNEARPNARKGVEAFASGCPFPVHYVHEPVRGIARARNAILDKAFALGAQWIAMIDDDETAAPDWIEKLMAPEYRHAPVLCGRRIWVYPEPRPFWAPDTEPRPPAEGAMARHGSTSNVRFSMALVHAGLRFDENMGLGGGSDQRFFNLAFRCGFALHVTNRAITYETVHPERLTYRFQISRHYAHSASLVSHKVKTAGYHVLAGTAPLRLLEVPLGVLELTVSVPAAMISTRHFKHFALRGGKRLAKVAGTLAITAGYLPQPYRQIAGN
jgi:succinoglycan biosynthesis protein ExoM